MSSPTQHEWREMEHAWVNRALVAERKLAALQSSHEEMVKALTVMLERCALVYTHPTLDPEVMKARKALDNAAKLDPTKADGKQAPNAL
jgi:hypothetical protein